PLHPLTTCRQEYFNPLPAEGVVFCAGGMFPLASAAATISPVKPPYSHAPGENTMRALLLALASGLLLVAPGHAQNQPKEIKVLIITGDHGDDWRKTTPFLQELLTKAGHKVDVTETPSKDLTAANLAKYDVLLLNYRNTPKGAKENPASIWTEENK